MQKSLFIGYNHETGIPQGIEKILQLKEQGKLRDHDLIGVEGALVPKTLQSQLERHGLRVAPLENGRREQLMQTLHRLVADEQYWATVTGSVKYSWKQRRRTYEQQVSNAAELNRHEEVALMKIALEAADKIMDGIENATQLERIHHALIPRRTDNMVNKAVELSAAAILAGSNHPNEYRERYPKSAFEFHFAEEGHIDPRHILAAANDKKITAWLNSAEKIIQVGLSRLK